MKNFEQLEEMYEKEVSLSEKHQKNAADIKKQMELLKGKTVNQKINTLRLTGPEYDRLMKLLSAGKKTVLEAIEIVLGTASDDRNRKGEMGGEEHEYIEKAAEAPEEAS